MDAQFPHIKYGADCRKADVPSAEEGVIFSVEMVMSKQCELGLMWVTQEQEYTGFLLLSLFLNKETALMI